MERKATAGHVEIKSADQGLVTAVVATLGVRDLDGDVTAAGAFTDGAAVVVSPYQHGVWSGAAPVGKGRLRVLGDEVLADVKFFLDTAAGKDSFAVVKALAEDGIGEWSYGFDLLDSEPGEHNGQRVRVLKRLKVHEVSPVLVGAGIGTRTLSAKSAPAVDDAALTEFLRFVKTNLAHDLAAELQDIKAALELHEDRARQRRLLLNIRDTHRRNR